MTQIHQDHLNHFSGTSQWYKQRFLPFVYTDGVKYLKDNGADWLVTAIASHQGNSKVRQTDFQAWKLTVNEDNSCVLECTDGNKGHVVTQKIPFTDFPLPEIRLWLINDGQQWTLLLPSEY